MAYIKNPEAKDKKGLVDYNVHIFQDAINKVFERAWEKYKATDSSEADQKSIMSATQSSVEFQAGK